MYKRKIILMAISAILTCGLFEQCQTVGKEVQLAEKPFEKLSEYQFFTGALKELRPNDRVLPYDLNTPLFTDYAEKSRFVWMPEGTGAQYAEREAFTFPEGAVLIKNFYYSHDKKAPKQGRHIVETRLLINRGADWDAMTYIWNEEQTEAYLNRVGDILPVHWQDEDGAQVAIDYVVPNRNQCKGCHAYDDQFTPIGPKARHLNKDYSYEDGTDNQLDRWAAVGYLSGYDPAAGSEKVPQWDAPDSGALHDRAIAYLDINCGHCHNPHGPAHTSGLNLTAHQEMNINLGIGKAPVSAGKGSGGRDYSIVPGQPDESILVYRMESTDPGAMMPEIGRVLVHEEGVALIREWIEQMKVE